MKFDNLRRTIQADQERRKRDGVSLVKIMTLFYLTAAIAFIIFTR